MDVNEELVFVKIQKKIGGGVSGQVMGGDVGGRSEMGDVNQE